MHYFIECTHTYESALNTGIQRVVRNIVNESQDFDPARLEAIPVVLEDGELRPTPGKLSLPAPAKVESSALARLGRRAINAVKTYIRNLYNGGRVFLAALLPWQPWIRFLMAPRSRWGLTRLLVLPQILLQSEPPAVVVSRPGITVAPGDVLVLLDSSWHLDIWPAIIAAKQAGATVVCVIYDLIPYTHPQFCDQSLVGRFNQWMTVAMAEVDTFICISRTVAEQVKGAVPVIAPGRTRPVATSYFWLGSELDGHQQGHGLAPIPEVARIVAAPTPVYLYVSTIEPRKNHAYALSAFDALWQSGVAANLVIVGRIGWRCDELLDRIRHHPQFGKQLFMLNDADDNALAQLYDRANGLVFSSITEGFGLPLVEALQRGLPVFASDIPVFREIASEGVTFVDLNDPQALSQALQGHIDAGAQRLPAPVPWLSWKECTEQFWSRLEECLASRKS